MSDQVTDQVADQVEPQETILATPEAPKVYSEGTKFAEGWIGSVAKELEMEQDSLSTLKKFNSLPQLAKSYAELEKMKRPDNVTPGVDSPPEDWAKFYGTMGRPETPEGYSYEGEKNEYFNTIASVAHKVGLTDAQFKELAAANDSFVQQTMQDSVATKQISQEEAIATLKNDWGQLMFSKNLEKAQLATQYLTQRLGVDEKIFTDKYGDDPLVIKMLSIIGSRLVEDETVAPSGDGLLSLEDKIRDLRKSEGYQKSDPTSMARMVELQRKKIALQNR